MVEVMGVDTAESSRSLLPRLVVASKLSFPSVPLCTPLCPSALKNLIFKRRGAQSGIEGKDRQDIESVWSR